MTRRKVIKLHDGDSGQFANGEHFRLANVRAHEKHQFGGSTAKRVLAGMLARSNNLVNVKVLARDSYGRLLVELSNHEGSINQRMRNKGYTNKGR